MDKKELILTTAKELMIAYKINDPDAPKTEKKIESIGRLLSLMAKEVEQVYNKIPN